MQNQQTLPALLKELSAHEARMIAATKNAESAIGAASLLLYSDGSGAILYKWTQRFQGGSKTDHLLATVLAKQQDTETTREFDSLEELAYLLSPPQKLG
jgi:hypothetical protein